MPLLSAKKLTKNFDGLCADVYKRQSLNTILVGMRMMDQVLQEQVLMVRYISWMFPLVWMAGTGSKFKMVQNILGVIQRVTAFKTV